MDEDEPLPGWPAYFSDPLDWGEVDGVAWAICMAGPKGMRTINGYARIPEGHPWSGCTDYADLAVDAHGGLTFGPDGGWIGFDTLHLWDAWDPQELARWGIEQDDLGLMMQFADDEQHAVWWTGEMVIEEAKSLAAQIARAGIDQPRRSR